MSNSKEIFKAIFEDSRNKGTANKVRTTECDSVLNDIVRPTIQDAAEEIKLDKVRFDKYNHEPFILVIGDYDPHDEIRFICRDGKLLVRVKHTGENSVTDSFALSDVTKELITNQINRFLRRSLRLPQRDSV